MHWILLAALMTTREPAQGPKRVHRQACSAAFHGRFWPDSANTDMGVARRLAQCGGLEICTQTGRHFKWSAVTVNIRQLGTTPLEPTSECTALVARIDGGAR